VATDQDDVLHAMHAMHASFVGSGLAGSDLCSSGRYDGSAAVALGLTETGVVVTG
jgi:hypothetical protein